MMVTLLLLLCFQQPSRLSFVEPVETSLAGKTLFRLESEVSEDDILGLELFINGQSAHYFDVRPFEVTLDMSSYPEGKVTAKAVLTLFGDKEYVAVFSGENHPHFMEQNVHLIRVPVSVWGERAEGLALEDFSLEEDGRPQKIDLLFNESKPMQLVVLLDTSGSMERHLHMLRRGMTALLETLRPGDRVQVIGFNHEVFEVSPPEEDFNLIKERLYGLQAKGSTNLYGAVWSGVNATSKTNQRRALVVFTDGDHDLDGMEDPFDKTTRDCIDLAREHGIPIFTMGLGMGINTRVLAELADTTGGRTYLFRSMKAARAAFVEVGEELRRQYLVCYYTNVRKSGWHEITVKTRGEHELRYPKKVFFR